MTLLGTWLVSHLILRFIVPVWEVYPHGLLAHLQADYAPWDEQNQLLLPPLNPQAVQAAERDKVDDTQEQVLPAAVLPPGAGQIALGSTAQPTLTPSATLTAEVVSPTITRLPVANGVEELPSSPGAATPTQPPMPPTNVLATTAIPEAPVLTLAPPTLTVLPFATDAALMPTATYVDELTAAPLATQLPIMSTTVPIVPQPTTVPTVAPPIVVGPQPTWIPTRTVMPTFSAMPTVPTWTPTHIAMPSATSTALVTLTPTWTPTPSATSTALVTLTPTWTPTPSATPTALPSFTPTPSLTATPGVVACQNVTFEPQATTNGSKTTLTIKVRNASTKSIKNFDLLIRVLKNADEDNPSTSASASINAAPPSNSSSKIDYEYNTGSISSREVYVQAAYESTGTPLTSDDSFRVRFSVAGVNCAVGVAFPPAPTGGGQPITITFVNPSSNGQVYTQRAEAAIETIVKSGGGSNGEGISWMSFTIVDEATDKVVWDWIEYYVPYCAFGTTNNKCLVPPAAWWDGIANGRYRLEVVVRAADGGSAFATRHFNVVHPTPTPLPTSTPTVTPTPTNTATPTNTSTPTSTSTPTNTATPTDTPTPTITPVDAATETLPIGLPTDVALPTETPTEALPPDTPIAIPEMTNTPTASPTAPAGVLNTYFKRVGIGHPF